MSEKIRIWHPFSGELYRYEWHTRNIFGVIRQLLDDIKYSYQRIRYGYCEYDLWSIDAWFLDIMPRMLEEHKRTRCGSPVVNESDIGNDKALEKAWDDILDRMIFLLREASEETCTRTNIYQAEYDAVNEEFRKKYGELGEKLMTEQEKHEAQHGRGHRVYFASDLPEYRGITDKYMAEQNNIDTYRNNCKDEAFILFSKWFYSLWD